MSAGHDDGEMFVDTWGSQQVSPVSNWDNLSKLELLHVKMELENKLWAFQSNPAIAVALKQGIQQVDALINSQSA